MAPAVALHSGYKPATKGQAVILGNPKSKRWKLSILPFMSESATSPVFIVTGARRGIGDAIVQELRKSSAHPSLLKPL
jgi:hypothetical protein